MTDLLTANAIEDINNDLKPADPKLQVLSIKKIQQGADPTKPERFRLQLSDGRRKQPSAMLATQLNHLVKNDDIQVNGIIKLDRYICNTVSEHRIIIILGVTVLKDGSGGQIGQPEALSAKPSGSAAAAAPQPAAAAAPAPAPAVKAEPRQNNPYSNKGRAGNNAAPRGGMSAGAGHQPISSLNPYLSRWTIQVRITNKSEKTYTNAKGEGKLFSIDMIDETGEMRATGFNQDADRLGPLFEIGKCYQIRGGRIKPANRRFSHLNNDYELTFGHETEAVEIEDSGSVAKQKFDYVDFARFEAMDKENAFVDVLAVITDIQELSSIVTKKDQRELKKRELELMDKSNIAVRCTLWGKDAMNFNHPAGSIISIKAASLRDFQGASLSAGMSAVIEVNPDSEEAHDLRVWYDTEGKTSAPIRIARTGGGGGGGGDRRIMLSQIKDENMGMSPDGKADYFLTKATITFVRKSENMMYKACASADCNKKVIEENDSEYRCEKCNRTMDSFKWRIIPGFSVCDPTGQTWVSAFSEVAEKIFGHATQEMGETRETNPEQFEKIIEGAFFKTVMMKCRAKAEVYNDESRVKVTLNEVWPVDPVVESKYLIEQIKAY